VTKLAGLNTAKAKRLSALTIFRFLTKKSLCELLTSTLGPPRRTIDAACLKEPSSAVPKPTPVITQTFRFQIGALLK
jgi:hypothetical protein